MQADFLRYSCQMVLPGFGAAAQKRLKEAKVFIAGAGGLGCPAALYLAAAGIGTLGIADYDRVSVSNLHRQVLYSEEDAGSPKVASAAAALRRQNPHIQINEHSIKIGADNVMDLLASYDMVVDATDNFDARYLLNDACVLLGKPLVYGAIYQYEGQVAVWNLLNPDGTRSPNYRDVFPEVDATQIPDCTVGGVTPPLAGMIGCMQANEVIKYFSGTGELLAGKLLLLDAATLQTRLIKIGSASHTPVTSLPATAEVPTISAKDLTTSLAGKTVELVDVRNPDERAAFHIGGTHIPLSELENKIDSISTQKPVVFYCASGKRSAEAVKRWRKQFPQVPAYSLEGGLKGWTELSEP
ncbi:MAG: HesA/MoeB/ThiF family protein [Williamsia sp.]|nr:HesA/MoeB/ThiF family protein [Williamsia sp.]